MDKKAIGLIVAAMAVVVCGTASDSFGALAPTTGAAGTPNATNRVWEPSPAPARRPQRHLRGSRISGPAGPPLFLSNQKLPTLK